MELFNRMKNKLFWSGCLSVLFAIIIIPGLIYLLLLLYGRCHTFNRTFHADVMNEGYGIEFTEVEHDSILAFSFQRQEDGNTVSTLFVHNNAFDVVSFIFTKDTIYIRDEMKFQDLFPPEERDKNSPTPKDWVKRRIIKGELSSPFKIIPYSDSLFFVYDTNKHKYILKDSTMHIFNLVHNVERANEYCLFDESLKDMLEIHLKECAKQ